MDSALIFVALFTVATIVAIIVRRFPVPYTVALVIAGAGGHIGLPAAAFD